MTVKEIESDVFELKELAELELSRRNK